MDAFKNFFDARYKKELFAFLKFTRPSSSKAKYFNNPSKFEAELPFRGRIKDIGEALFSLFGRDFRAFKNHVHPVLLEQLENGIKKNPFFWDPFSYIVQHHGLEHFDLSMQLIEAITQISTAEFAIRPFISTNPNKALKQMKAWSQSKNEHLRRLSSEGSRPRLPWGQNLQVIIDNPQYSLEILENLKEDESLYVRKSVANHLNDHSWKNPEFFYKVIETWNKSEHAHTQWIIKHALRSEIKKACPQALKIIGIQPMNSQAELAAIEKPVFQEEFILEASLANLENVKRKFVADLKLLLPGKNSTRIKVFKGWNGELAAKESKTVQKKFSLKDNSVRKYYPGDYRIELLLNGEVKTSIKFTV